jgi:hypothetical protein
MTTLREAYDMIDRFLRNNLYDDDYANYAEALELLSSEPPQHPAEYGSEADAEELLRIGAMPEPLRLAAMLEKTMQWPLHGKAADCLRRMHNESLSGCKCPECKVVLHASDCDVHNEPAYPKSECNCGATKTKPVSAPPQRKPLTDEQIDAGVAAWFATETVVGGRPFEKRMRAAIEAAHGIGDKE